MIACLETKSSSHSFPAMKMDERLQPREVWVIKKYRIMTLLTLSTELLA